MSEQRPYIDIVFDGEPGPEAPRFVEVESPAGRGIHVGVWTKRTDGYWALRIPPEAFEITRCMGCEQEVDPTMCYCGEPAGHALTPEHSFVPMGCICHRRIQS